MAKNHARYLRHRFIALMRRFGWDVRRVPAVERFNSAFSTFTDSSGYKHKLIKNYRRTIWQQSWDDVVAKPTDPASIRKAARDHRLLGINQKNQLVSCIKPFGIDPCGLDVIEIGCSAGGTCAALCTENVKSVTGLDSTSLYCIDENPPQNAIDEMQRYFSLLRDEIVRQTLDAAPPSLNPTTLRSIQFEDTLIEHYKTDRTFDLAVSWDALEHMVEAEAALARIKDILKPGGYAAIFYHPFFCETGGHFDVTDIPWGHALLSSDDLRAYMKKYHPDEVEISDFRLTHLMNRLTRNGLKDILHRQDLELIEEFPITFGKPGNVPPGAVAMAANHYPDISLYDFLAEYVFVLVQKTCPMDETPPPN